MSYDGMDTHQLEQTAKHLVADGRGILAADESNASCQKRFDAVGIKCNEETRRQYRQILVTSPQARESLSGVIFFDETFWQQTDDGQDFRDFAKSYGILPGIKVDEGLVDLPGFAGEKVSKGLDSLPDRIAKYAEAGAKFAKWRSVITINEGIPTDECIGANTFVLSRYARICQDAGIVPMVEPEILFDGTHTIERCQEVMTHTFDILFQTMRAFRVHLPGAILKTSMVLPGKDSGHPINHDDVAERTVRVLHEHVPHDLGGVVFLSGGQTPDDAFINLNRIAQKGPHPWGVTFSFSRALQDPVLKAWAKVLHESNMHDSSQPFLATTSSDSVDVISSSSPSPEQVPAQKSSGHNHTHSPHEEPTGSPEELFAEQLKKVSAAQAGHLDETKHGEKFVSHSQDL